MLYRLILLAMVVLLNFTAVCAQAESKVFTLTERAPVEIVGQVRELLDSGEKAVAAGPTIVVQGSAESIAAVGKLIAALDRQPEQLIIRVSNERHSQLAGQRILATGERPAGGPGTHYLGNDFHRLEYSLRVQEGAVAWLEIGRDIPYTEEWAAFSGDINGYRERTAYQKITTGFRVVPVQVMGDKVLVALDPEFMDASGGSGNRAPEIDFSRYHSQMYLPLDTWVELGGQFNSSNRLGRAIISSSTGSGVTKENIFIKIERAAGFSP